MPLPLTKPLSEVDTAKVPLVVIGEPLTEKPVGIVRATEVTVPPPPLTATHSTSVWPLLTAKTLPLLPVYEGSKFTRAPACVEAPVPPSATAKSVIPEILPPVIATLFEFCEDNVPRVGLFRISASPLTAVQSALTLTSAPAAIPESLVFSTVV